MQIKILNSWTGIKAAWTDDSKPDKAAEAGRSESFKVNKLVILNFDKIL